MDDKYISPIGDDWQDLRAEIFTPEEIAECDLKVSIIGELIKARHENGLTQKELEAASGVKQPVIARMERGTTDPQLSTVMRVLASLGKTLAVVPLAQNARQSS
ncbi:MAG: helix-turn-helix domain-containing protein [Defluviitaleaceae bacterium]|nr:helix-turn-helix domain-containing protein [Defluviitaleaceae bacterium]